uniref:Coiled-coil domain-containing protein 151-like n=1 Tax=Stegastes partitus TaxID=144197 RepID=A0A3B5B3Q5_9TELE
QKMAFSAESIKPPLQEQTTELKRKIQLLESDRATYYESTQSSIKKNKQSILQLRQQNKELRRRLAEITSGMYTVLSNSICSKTLCFSQEAATTLDHRVMSKRKRLNALKATTQTNQRRLEELNMKYRRLKSEGSGGTASADIRNLKEEEDAMVVTSLTLTNMSIFVFLWSLEVMLFTDESLTFEGQLDSLEAEILKHREEHQKLQVINNDAQLSRKATEAGLQQLEESLFKERKERERLKTSYTKKAEELKAQAEKADRRVQRTIIQPDELSSEAPHSTTRMAGEEEKVMSTFEEAFRRNKEAAEVTDSQEIVDPITSQGETRQHLEKLKKENEEVLVQLKQQKELLNQDFENIKYSGGVKFSSDQQTLEECEQQLQAEQQRCNAGKERLHGLVKAFSTARPAVEHLIDKLQHITVVKKTKHHMHPDSDVYVVELMTQLELKLQVLQQELQGKDLAAIKKEMEEEEFHVRIEDKLPEYNTRVRLPEDEAADLFTDEDASGESEANIISREALKRQSKLIADANFKRKPWKKKKGKF